MNACGSGSRPSPALAQPARRPRVLCVTRGDYLTLQMLRGVLDPARYEVLAVVVTGDDRGRTGPKMLRALWRAAEPHYFFYECAQAGFFAFANRLLPGTPLDVAAFARARGIPVLSTPDVNAPRVVGLARDFSPDVLLCAKCPQRLRRPLLSAARYGNINVHASLLPQQAGRAPHFWTLACGAQPGATAHYMTERFDDGPVLVQRSWPAPPGISAFDLLLALSRLGGEIAPEAVGLALHGAPGTAQDPAERTYGSHPTREAYRTFRARGHRLIHSAGVLDALRAELRGTHSEAFPR